jgi:HD-GYP domain-containing protein (c-di-GMP phosphodiesterase class II)
MLYSIITFLKSLVSFKAQANEQKIFASWVYAACMSLMLFFLAGYIVMGIACAYVEEISKSNFISALIFFFGSIFVCIMVTTLRRMSAALSKKTEEIIKTLVKTIEAKDRYTRGHSIHVANITELIYDNLPERLKNKICKTRLMDAAILHDIGKIGISDAILNKPGSLTPEERDVIEQHAVMGKRILEPTSYQLIGEIICCHHERIDGTGYFKMAADQIPLESKIIAVADTFSALCTDRVYRTKKSYEEAIRIIQDAAGTQLDAEIVDVFCALPEHILEKAGILSV